jgi:hypothetical protein
MRSDLLSGGIRRFRDAFLPRISRMTRIRNEGSPILSQRAQICFWSNPSLPCHPHPGPLPLARERENRRPPTGKPTAELAGRPHKSPRPFRCCSFSQGEKVRMRASHSQKQICAPSVLSGKSKVGFFCLRLLPFASLRRFSPPPLFP